MQDMKIKGHVFNELLKVLGKLNVIEIGHILKVDINKDGQKVVSLAGSEPIPNTESESKPETEKKDKKIDK